MEEAVNVLSGETVSSLFSMIYHYNLVQYLSSLLRALGWGLFTGHQLGPQETVKKKGGEVAEQGRLGPNCLEGAKSARGSNSGQKDKNSQWGR